MKKKEEIRIWVMVNIREIYAYSDDNGQGLPLKTSLPKETSEALLEFGFT